MSCPAVVIRLEIESRPAVYIHAEHEGDALRLEDWLNAHPAYLDLLARVDALNQERHS